MKGYLDIMWTAVAASSNPEGNTVDHPSYKPMNHDMAVSDGNSPSWEREISSCTGMNGQSSSDDSKTAPQHESEISPRRPCAPTTLISLA